MAKRIREELLFPDVFRKFWFPDKHFVPCVFRNYPLRITKFAFTDIPSLFSTENNIDFQRKS
jgi:hypothetical protein